MIVLCRNCEQKIDLEKNIHIEYRNSIYCGTCFDVNYKRFDTLHDCDHSNYDEFFEKCTNCNATFEQLTEDRNDLDVIKENVRSRL